MTTEERRRAFPKVDAHHHIWDLDAHSYPWLQEGPPRQRVYGNSAPLRRNYRIEDYLADVAPFRVEKSVYLQCGWNPADPVGETRYAQAVADAQPEGFPHGIVAHSDLDAPGVEDELKRHCESPNMRGIRMLLSHHDTPAYQWAPRGDYLTDPAWRRGYEALARQGLSFDAQLYPHQMPELARIAAEVPEVPLVIDHCGMPIERESGGLARWRDGMAALAALPHVHLKISGLGMVDHHWTVESLRPIVNEAIGIFGPDRCMFASNFPVDGLKSSLATLFDAFLEILAPRPLPEQQALFHDNAVRFYRL
ncbi:amidohydrolase family protein [Cereibacter azotoformans]|uniref:amidohydrolase family protein n=1 Tax=Cereibacter azotoformans TaxID=43057 RepID=UPI001EE9EA39|nr:amidohydrolase family protein [Cereibacter azotoformans]ULB09746.1 amidohydrolase family protein [Cereibacter azotoformans]